MRVPNFHTALNSYLEKYNSYLEKDSYLEKYKRFLETFLEILIWKNINSRDVLKGLDSAKFFEILQSNETPNKLSNHQLRIVFKHPNFVREPF